MKSSNLDRLTACRGDHPSSTPGSARFSTADAAGNYTTSVDATLFGYPQAQENDAERAVRAALAIQRALSDLNARNAAKSAPELSAPIGIESGPVVVEASGEVFGDAPNVAARVQAAAEPGSVLVTLNVQRQVAGLFVAESKARANSRACLSLSSSSGIVLRQRGGGRRGGARTPTPFVGREEELGLLTPRWEQRLRGRRPTRAGRRRARPGQVAAH